LALARLQEATDYPDSPTPSRCNTPEPPYEPQLRYPDSPTESDASVCDVLEPPYKPYVPTPVISDAIASFKTKYDEDFPSEYFDQYGIFGVDELPIGRADWYIDKLFITEELAEKWVNHITGIYDEYKAKVMAAHMV
jgi:hypothetical protein